MIMPFKGLFYEGTTMVHAQGPSMYGRKGICSDLELNFAECLEAYGAIKGSQVCAKFLEDLRECCTHDTTIIRNQIMFEERMKKLVKGEISFENRWGSKYSADAFFEGSFIP